MSASDKKKLRKEAEAALLTEKQKKQLAEEKKMKAITISFIAIMLVIALTATTILGIRGYKKAGFIDRMTTAAVTGSHELNSVMVNYYYIDHIKNTYNEIKNNFGDSASMYLGYMGINANAPLNTQPVSEGSTKTWADYYLEAALSKAKNDLALCDKANAEGFKLSEEDEKTIQTNAQMLEYYAPIYGYSSVNKYLKAMYGNGANLKSYNEYVRITVLASAYYNAHSDSLKYDDAAIRAYEKDKFYEYSDYTYAIYNIKVSSYLTGGTKNADGSMTYTAEEKAAAQEKAKADMEKLKAITGGLDAFDAAISELEINQPKDSTSEGTSSESAKDPAEGTTDEANKDNTTEGATDETVKDENTEGTTDETKKDEGTAGETTEDKKNTVVSEKKDVVKYIDLPEDYREWMTKADRKNGDITVFNNETTSKDSDGKDVVTVESYDVVCFMERDDNKQPMANVRHLLVEFEGGTTDSKGNKTYSDAEKAAAKAEAERLLQVWKDGAKTEESFIALVKEHSDDAGSKETGGLYEDVNPDSNYVPEFLAWSTDSARKTGDTGVILTDYGYHVMYFSSYDEVTYRDYMIETDLRADDMEKWYNAIVEPVTITTVNTKRIKMDFVMGNLG